MRLSAMRGWQQAMGVDEGAMTFLADDLGVPSGQITVVKDCGAARRRLEGRDAHARHERLALRLHPVLPVVHLDARHRGVRPQQLDRKPGISFPNPTTC